jgi:hypothetical protein
MFTSPVVGCSGSPVRRAGPGPWAPSPQPGAGGNQLWGVGQQLGPAAPDQPLIEHWDGEAWSVVESLAATP